MQTPFLKRIGGFVFLAALAAGPSSILVAQQSANATASSDTSDEKVLVMEKYEVVGSRIKRVDAEGPQPVLSITSADIETRGYQTLGDFIQTLSFNSGTTNSVIQTASFLRGAATANPRGLGANRFLVLIDGRRTASYPFTDSNSNSVFNFNSIPTGAIDSIEYLKDGASAIYGSDAVTGVMNIKLKKNFSGLSADYYVSQSTGGHDHLIQQANVTVGARGEKTSVMATLSHQRGNATFIKDYGRSRTTDYLSVSGDSNKATNQNSSFNWPANLTLTTAQAQQAFGATALSGTYVITGGTPTANPAKSQFVRVTALGNENRYDFAQTYQLYPEYQYTSFFVNARHEITEKLEAFGSFMFSNNWTDYYFTPSVIQATGNPGTSPTGTLQIPSNNPYNPLGINITNFSYRTSFGPPRIFETEESTYSSLLGLRGDINEDWSWEVGATFASSVVASVSRNAMRASDLQAALNGTTRQTALNPFGPSDNPSVVNNLFTVSNRSAQSQSQTYDGVVTGKLFEIDSRPVNIAVGGELRREFLRDDPDTAAYVGSGGGTPFSGKRKVTSAYTELTVSPLKNLEVQAAVRYEDYSDFGETTKPKFGAKLRVLPWLMFRASYSESFKAPDLGRLYTTQKTAFSSTTLTDPKRPQDPAVQIKIVTGGNPNLQPEEADIKYGGIVVDVPGVKNLEFTLDWFQFDITNVISSPSINTILAREDIFPGGVVRDNTQGNPGPILFVQSVPFNIAKLNYEGVDYGLSYRYETARWGTFKLNTAWTQVLHSVSNTGIPQSNGQPAADFDNVGLYYNPEWKANGSVSWTLKDWTSAVSADYVGAWFNDGYTAAGWGEKPVTVYNWNVGYKGLYGYRITVGVNNVFNKQPPFNGRETSGFMQGIYGYMAAGRSVYLRVAKDW